MAKVELSRVSFSYEYLETNSVSYSDTKGILNLVKETEEIKELARRLSKDLATKGVDDSCTPEYLLEEFGLGSVWLVELDLSISLEYYSEKVDFVVYSRE